MAWNLTADFIETCSCNMLCPCWYGVRELMVMDQGWCASVWLLRVRQGNAEGVTLGGRTLALWHLIYKGQPSMTATARRASILTMGPVRSNAVSWRPSSGHQREALYGDLGRAGWTQWLPTQTAQIADTGAQRYLNRTPLPGLARYTHSG